ncbi:MAG: SulP family inorganic anion transporter [Oscillospiraceae bacterium]
MRASLQRELREWNGNIKGDILGGCVSAFSVIPEVIGFTIVAGVDPILGLYTSVVFLILMSFLGGRPAMVSAGAGSMAVVVVALIRDYGLQYLFAAVLLAGVFQFILGLCRVGNLLKFVPNSVVVGFCDALAIIIFKSQVKSCFQNMGSTPASILKMFAFIALGLLVIYLFPRITKAVPSTLVSIVVVALVGIAVGLLTGGNSDVAMISDLGNLKAAWPTVRLPQVAFNLETLKIILPYSISLAFVGLLESMLTTRVVDEMTHSPSRRNRECCAQGVGNLVCGLIGAMPGCAMIGQAIANVESGGRGRLSTLVSGVLLACLLGFGSAVLGAIPLAALIAVMIYVSITTFDWKNLVGMVKNRDLKSVLETIVTIVTVILVVATNNFAYGVAAGLVLSFVFWLATRNCKETTV